MAGRLALAGCIIFLSGAARAEGPLLLRFSAGPKEIKAADKALDKWIRALAKREFPAKMLTIVRNQAISRAQLGVTDMRDAVSASPAPHSANPQADSACSTLESCPTRVAAAHAGGISGLPDAVFAVVQPWILLQHRRGGGLSLRSDSADSGTLAALTLEGLVTAPIDICVSQAPMGGLQVWLRSAADLDDIYAFSREAALHPSQPQ